MSLDIENFFEINAKSISECGILHWSNYKKNIVNNHKTKKKK
jgi:hypothetical protein